MIWFCWGLRRNHNKTSPHSPRLAEHSVEYPGDIAVIQFDKTKTSIEALKAVIEKKGYKVEILKDKA